MMIDDDAVMTTKRKDICTGGEQEVMMMTMMVMMTTYLLLLVKSELFIFLPITPPPFTAPIDDPVELADVPVELDMTPELRALSSCDQSTVGATTP